jgi:hypothetical protein
MKLWIGNGYTITLLFSLKGLEILYKVRLQVKIIVMENLNIILLHKSRPANKQHKSITCPAHLDLLYLINLTVLGERYQL